MKKNEENKPTTIVRKESAVRSMIEHPFATCVVATAISSCIINVVSCIVNTVIRKETEITVNFNKDEDKKGE